MTRTTRNFLTAPTKRKKGVGREDRDLSQRDRPIGLGEEKRIALGGVGQIPGRRRGAPRENEPAEFEKGAAAQSPQRGLSEFERQEKGRKRARRRGGRRRNLLRFAQPGAETLGGT